METAIEDAAVGVENVLRAVAVVDVEVENGDLRTGRCSAEEMVGGEGGFVEVAVAAHGAPRCVVPGWTAERIDGGLTLQHQVGGGEGGAGGGPSQLACDAEERRAGVERAVGGPGVGEPFVVGIGSA